MSDNAREIKANILLSAAYKLTHPSAKLATRLDLFSSRKPNRGSKHEKKSRTSTFRHALRQRYNPVSPPPSLFNSRLHHQVQQQLRQLDTTFFTPRQTRARTLVVQDLMALAPTPQEQLQIKGVSNQLSISPHLARDRGEYESYIGSLLEELRGEGGEMEKERDGVGGKGSGDGKVEVKVKVRGEGGGGGGDGSGYVDGVGRGRKKEEKGGRWDERGGRVACAIVVQGGRGGASGGEQ